MYSYTKPTRLLYATEWREECSVPEATAQAVNRPQANEELLDKVSWVLCNMQQMWCQLTWCKYAVHILPACRERQILHLLQIADFVCQGSDSKYGIVVDMFVQPFEVKDLVSSGSSCCKVVKHN